ncbi:MGT family glycosyltransferase [Algoriphagus sp. 4150]|uniref:glycosyltransferase n=1 Tax=Algoriphagus sp. 4150 TaxID=2817756 RepID=UPI002863AD92|nr:glycosyltransferase [Algoriphagus sp. 4150]MDR7128127.1 MGT family glycosyltransferase [Algoriphagus sp. 4150]
MENNLKTKLAGKKILFASVPVDGHFNPMTGLAKHLQGLGCNVRWYMPDIFEEKIRNLNFPQYSYEKAVAVTLDNIETYGGRSEITDPLEKLNFDFIHMFAKRGPEYYEDIVRINETFPFDLLIADSFFSAIPFVKIKLNKPVITIGIVPLVEDSVDLAPFGMGLPPAKNDAERAEYAKIRDEARNVMFKQAVDTYDEILKSYDIDIERSMLPNLLCREATLCLQIGTPGFEYKRIDQGDNIRFIGALLPYLSEKQDRKPWFDERINRYKKIILVTQGTFEKDFTKLTEPTLFAFRDTDVLVIVTTAGNGTKELQEKYAAENIIIEDFIPFNDVMPYVDVFVTNGGYGGTLLSIHNRIPMVAGGVHEGKIEICSRIGYFKYGVNLGTETPDSEAIRNAVEEVMTNDLYKNNIAKLNSEMQEYNALELCEGYIAGILEGKTELLLSPNPAS